MKQKDLDKLRSGIDPELQHLVGDSGDYGDDGSDSPQTGRLDDLLMGINPTGSVAKATFDAQFKSYMFDGIEGNGLEVDHADDPSSAEFLKALSGERDFSAVQESEEDRQAAQDKFIAVARWLRDQVKKIKDVRKRAEVQKAWNRTFGFSLDTLNSDDDAREAVSGMVVNLRSRLIQEA